MKRLLVLSLVTLLAISQLTACSSTDKTSVSTTAKTTKVTDEVAVESSTAKPKSDVASTAETTKAAVPEEDAVQMESDIVQPEIETDQPDTIAGVSVNQLIISEDAAIEITSCPAYGDKSSPYVSGKLTKGDPTGYELICVIIVNNQYYGKKPYNDSPNSFIKNDGLWQVQFSSNDGQGTDWNAESIFIFLVPSGYQDKITPDVNAGYVVPPAQISDLKKDSICAVQIDREMVEEG